MPVDTKLFWTEVRKKNAELAQDVLSGKIPAPVGVIERGEAVAVWICSVANPFDANTYDGAPGLAAIGVQRHPLNPSKLVGYDAEGNAARRLVEGEIVPGIPRFRLATAEEVEAEVKRQRENKAQYDQDDARIAGSMSRARVSLVPPR